MINAGVIGLGKMGLSHHALLNAHPGVSVVGVCDSSSYVLRLLNKYTDVPIYSDYRKMLAGADLDAVVVATPSSSHKPIVEAAFEHGIHVFCEKPLTLSPADTDRLTQIGREQGLVTQVGYHNRFVATFREVKALLDAGAVGTVTHVTGHAYGPVVLKPTGRTWRSRNSEGGGCLYDYAAHVIDLMTWYLGEPSGVGGTVLQRVFSRETDDAAFSTLYFSNGTTGQVSVDWSDESYRKMTTGVEVRGTAGRIFADRQECQVYLRSATDLPDGYRPGWNIRYITDLTEPVWFYLRGEEYSAQIDAFVRRVEAGRADGLNAFESAAVTDRAIAMIAADARLGPSVDASSDNHVRGGASGKSKPARWKRPRRSLQKQ